MHHRRGGQCARIVLFLLLAQRAVPADVLDADGSRENHRAERIRLWRSQVRSRSHRPAEDDGPRRTDGVSAGAHVEPGGMRAAPGLTPEGCVHKGEDAIIFWVLPEADGDPNDGNDPGYLSDWGRGIFAPEMEFRSEEVVLHPSFCLPPGSPYMLDDCSVSMQYEGLDQLADNYPVCCSRSCSQVRDRPLAGGGRLRECRAMRKQNHEPGQFLMTASLACATNTTVGQPPITFRRMIHLDGSVQWQEHKWVLHSVASGDALTTARADVPASFLVVMADRDGSPRRSGGDHLLVTLSGPALVHAPVLDLGNGSYVVTYTVTDPGIYEVSVQLTFQREAGLTDPPPVGQYKLDPEDIVYAHIHGSPFSLHVSARSAEDGSDSCSDRHENQSHYREEAQCQRMTAREEHKRCSALDLLSGRGRWLSRSLCSESAGAQGPSVPCALLPITDRTQEYVWNPTCLLPQPMEKDSFLQCAADGVMGQALRQNMGNGAVNGAASRWSHGTRKFMMIGTSLQRELFHELVRLLGYTHEIDVTDKVRGFVRFTVPLPPPASTRNASTRNGIGGRGAEEIEVLFQWLEVTRGGGTNWPEANSSVHEYRLWIEQVETAVSTHGLGVGDVVLAMTSPYDVVHRPLAPAKQGASEIARKLAALQARDDGPTVIFRNADALHLPWISYGRAMRTPQDGMTVARAEAVSKWYTEAMERHGVDVLQTFGMTVTRSDQSRDGIHYRTTRHLSSNTVPRTVLQLVLLSLCADTADTARK